MVIGNIGKYFCQFQFAKYCGKQTFKHCFLYKVSNQCSCQYDQLQYPADHDIFRHIPDCKYDQRQQHRNCQCICPCCRRDKVQDAAPEISQKQDTECAVAAMITLSVNEETNIPMEIYTHPSKKNTRIAK